MLNTIIKPMLLQASSIVVPHKNWIHQIKWDGFRILIHYNNGIIRAFTRNGSEVTDRFPELQKIRLNCSQAILDGECIVLDPAAKPCFEDVMNRFHAKRLDAVLRLSHQYPAHFAVYDLIFHNGESLLKSRLRERLELLLRVVVPSPVISVTSTYEDGESLFQKIKQLGLEGIVSKNADSHYYLDSRPKNVWIKTKNYRYGQFEISGIRKSEFGWSLTDDGKHMGVIEFPPPSDVLNAFRAVAKQIVTGESKDWIYLKPVLTCNVKFQCYTKDSKLRHPIFESFVF
ncbi:RNA ligase family protein [Paenibacillus sp. R14(2021)]|uniref:ATP-dependent DNA ligase n=1 Tax=Paenibacillus sp. R14(2021) TaxID=2859228 RepID=UPI001C6117E5|nr:RNA ligase family protein [Paenibacillus sp. R14(2021)]